MIRFAHPLVLVSLLGLLALLVTTLRGRKGGLVRFLPAALLLIALAIGVEILFGSSVPFFGSVVGNITGLLSTLGDNGLVGLVALGIILFVFHRRRAVSHT